MTAAQDRVVQDVDAEGFAASDVVRRRNVGAAVLNEKVRVGWPLELRPVEPEDLPYRH